MSTVFIGLAAIFFILGIFFILKGVFAEEQSAVPISNPKEIAEFKSAFVPPVQKANASFLPEAGETKPAQISEKQIQIDRLTAENQQLKQQITEHQNKFEGLERNVEIFKREHHQLKESEAEKIRNLETKISNIQLEKEQLLLTQKLFEELKEKGQYFEKQYAESQTRQTELREYVRRLESERDYLLKSQKQGVDRTEFEALSSRLEGAIITIEGLKGKNKDLELSNRALQEDFKSTEELNAQLREKEKIMQYELAKNRAQALGLEKICEDFKKQIEEMSAVSVRG
jgi:chromosome segregation ATPase